MNKEISRTQRVLNVWAITLIIWSVYRAQLHMPEWFDELIAKPLVFLVPMYLFITHIDQKKFLEDIWFQTTNIWTNVKIALLIGLVFAVSAFIANAIRTGTFSISSILLPFNNSSFYFALVLVLATGFTEEALSRGFVLKQLFQESGQLYSSVFLSSIFFLILHIPILLSNYSFTGQQLLIFFGTDFLLSLVNSFVFLNRRSLIPVILIHAFYNLAILMYI